ncbi:hypothetical protein ACHAXT_001215 [Thalassiosira profunda]
MAEGNETKKSEEATTDGASLQLGQALRAEARRRGEGAEEEGTTTMTSSAAPVADPNGEAEGGGGAGDRGDCIVPQPDDPAALQAALQAARAQRLQHPQTSLQSGSGGGVEQQISYAAAPPDSAAIALANGHHPHSQSEDAYLAAMAVSRAQRQARAAASPLVQFGPGGSVEQVERATAQPSARSLAIGGLAPPSFTPDDAPASQGTPNKTTAAPEAAVRGSPNGKVCSHVERAPPSPPRSGSSRASSAAHAAAAIGDAVERVVAAAEGREATARESSLANGGSSNGGGGRALDSAAAFGGPFAAVELGQLALHCASSSTTTHGSNATFGNGGKLNLGAWASLDGDTLASLAPMLRAHVVSAAGIDLVGEGRDVIVRHAEARGEGGRPAITINQWMTQSAKYAGPDSAPLGALGASALEPGGGHRRLQILLCGLEAANILLAIMASPGVDRRAVEDDTIEACVNLIKGHLQKHVIPSLSNTGHLGMTLGGKGGEEEGDAKSPKAKRAKTLSPTRSTVVKGLRSVYTPILSTVGALGTAIERAGAFVLANEMDDALLFTLSAAALSSLTIDPSTTVRVDAASLASIVQVSAMDLIAAIFGRYPRHRSIIVEDLFPLMLKLPTSKRSLRTYLVRRGGSVVKKEGDEQAYIQPICALTLLLVQSCVVMPFQSDEEMVEADASDEDEEMADDDDSAEKRAKKANDTSGLDGCATICAQFTSEMLRRCSRKGEEGGASEFRPVLANLIDDLLRVRYLIEFPAAEMLLLSLASRLSGDLLRASSMTKGEVEATYLATAMDAFGKVASAVAGTRRQNREHPFKLPDSMSPDLESPEPAEEVNRCHCGRGKLDTFMIDCDRCHSCCVGITKDTVPDSWCCDDCTLQTTILKQAKVFARGGDGSGALTSRDHNHVLRQFLLGHLARTAQSSASPQADKAREFFIATWVKDLTLEKDSDGDGAFDLGLVRSHVVAQWSPPREQSNRSLSQLTDDGNQRIVSSLVSSSELSSSFPRLLGVLLRLMGDKSASLRKLSLKAFLQVVNTDPSLMTQSSVRKEVSRCFVDEAISVREAAVSLVGDYVLQSPNLASAFHAPLLERMVDKGISVRKRAVRIFRDILLSNPSYGGRATAMHKMLQRADDRKEDDGVRDLVHETFHDLWFNGKAFEMGKSALVMPADVPASNPSSPGKTMTKAQVYCREAAKQMVEVVKVSSSPDYLTSLVRGLLFGFSEGDKDKKMAERKRRQEDSRNQCNSLVLALIELLLSFEDTRSHEEDDGKELVALLSTLSVFSQSYPELLVPHMDTLEPYLKGDNGAKKYETAIVSTVSSIVSLASTHFSGKELARLTGGGLPTDLVNIAYKFPPAAVSSAVEALANLANHPDAKPGSLPEKKLFSLAVQFYSYLLKNKDKSCEFLQSKKSLRDNVRRALSALGSICRFYHGPDNHDNHNLDPNSFVVVTDVKQLHFSGNVLSSACFALFREYLDKEDESTKCLALRAMNGVFISRPRVVLAAEQLGIIGEAIAADSPPSVQIESLRCWRDILLAEEKRIESGAAKDKMDHQKDITLSKRISGDQDGDACISGSILTKHADRLYELTLSKDEKVRQMIIDLIGHLLRQGLINPMATVPHLLAVQGDVKSPATRSLALKLLINEGEKRPDMLRQRICAGLKQAFFFQKEVYPHDADGVPRVTALLQKTEGHHVVTETIFDAVIKESAIRNKRAQRQGLLKGIISLFEKDPDHEHTDADQLPLLAFASEILAHLPYNSLDDPLFISYHASSITALDGQTIVSEFAKLTDGDVFDPNPGEDEIERAAKKRGKFDPEALGIEASSSAEFGKLCVDACRILPLLLLKNFLRKAYSLTEARLTEYVPSQKEKPFEKGISMSDSIAPFACNFKPIFDAQGEIDWNAAIQVYSSFRRLLRDVDDEELHADPAASPKKSGTKRKRGQEESSPKVSPEEGE